MKVISLAAAVVISIALIGGYVYTTKKVTSALAADLTARAWREELMKEAA